MLYELFMWYPTYAQSFRRYTAVIELAPINDDAPLLVGQLWPRSI